MVNHNRVSLRLVVKSITVQTRNTATMCFVVLDFSTENAIDLMHDDVISHCIVVFVVTVFSLRCTSLTTTALHSYTA